MWSTLGAGDSGKPAVWPSISSSPSTTSSTLPCSTGNNPEPGKGLGEVGVELEDKTGFPYTTEKVYILNIKHIAYCIKKTPKSVKSLTKLNVHFLPALTADLP